MRLVPSAEQAAFAATLHDLLTGADLPAAAESWAGGDTAPGRAVWRRLADAGVTGLLVPARWGGAAGTPADLVMAAEELGHHALPGPVAESIAAVPALLTSIGDEALCGKWLPELAAGRVLASLAAPPWLPYAADADAAELVLLADENGVWLARSGTVHASLDPARRLAEVTPGARLAPPATYGLEMGVLAGAAQLLGAGRALLEETVRYATARTQFGRPIGSFQAIQHRLADVAVGLEFARPLLYAAAVTTAARDVSAAKVACGAAAQRAARAALQVHGAVGYTREHGLGRWLTKVRVLDLAWGTPAQHRARVLAEVTR